MSGNGKAMAWRNADGKVPEQDSVLIIHDNYGVVCASNKLRLRKLVVSEKVDICGNLFVKGMNVHDEITALEQLTASTVPNTTLNVENAGALNLSDAVIGLYKTVRSNIYGNDALSDKLESLEGNIDTLKARVGLSDCTTGLHTGLSTNLTSAANAAYLAIGDGSLDPNAGANLKDATNTLYNSVVDISRSIDKIELKVGSEELKPANNLVAAANCAYVRINGIDDQLEELVNVIGDTCEFDIDGRTTIVSAITHNSDKISNISDDVRVVNNKVKDIEHRVGTIENTLYDYDVIRTKVTLICDDDILREKQNIEHKINDLNITIGTFDSLQEGATAVAGNLAVTNKISALALDVSGALSRLVVDDNGTIVTGAFTANGGAIVNGGLTTNNETVTGVLTVNGGATIKKSNDRKVVVDDAGTTVTGAFVATGGATVTGGLTTNTETVSGLLTVNGGATIKKDDGRKVVVDDAGTTVTGAFTANDGATIKGNEANKLVVATTGTTVTGSFVANDGATIKKDDGRKVVVDDAGTTVTGAFTANGGATIKGNEANKLVVATAGTTVTGAFIANGNATVNGGLVTNTETVNGLLTVNGGANVSSGMTVTSGKLKANDGAVVVGKFKVKNDDDEDDECDTVIAVKDNAFFIENFKFQVKCNKLTISCNGHEFVLDANGSKMTATTPK